MPKQINILMEDHYPFGGCEEYASPDTKILVRQIIEIDQNSTHKNQIMLKCKLIKKLSQHGIAVAIYSILQQDESVHILYEYVPIKLQKWIQNINEEFIQKFSSQIRQFAKALAECQVITDFSLSDIGMDQNYNPKYFMGINFKINKQQKKQHLYQIYLKQIQTLFKPYLSRLSQGNQNYFYGVSQRKGDNNNNNNNNNNKLSDTKQLKNIIEYINLKQNQDLCNRRYNPIQQNNRLLNKKKSIEYFNFKNVQAQMSGQGQNFTKLRKHQSINVNFNKIANFQNKVNNNAKQRKQSALSVLSSSSNIRLNNLVRRINQLKFHAQHIVSPSSSLGLSTHKFLKDGSIPKNSSQKYINNLQRENLDKNSYNRRVSKSPQIRDIFGQSKKNEQYPPFGFVSIQNAMKLTKKLASGLLTNSKNLKKNQSLKQRQYQGMVQSDNKYFQDFANVLQDSTHEQILNSQQMNQLEVKTKQRQPKNKYLEYQQQVKTSTHNRNRSKDFQNYTENNEFEQQKYYGKKQSDLRKTFKALDNRKLNLNQNKKSSRQKSTNKIKQIKLGNDLKDRVKNAIQNSKYLINQFNITSHLH